MQQLKFEQIQQAYDLLRPVVHETPLQRSRTFSELVGCDLYLKMENLQKTGSFKLRGAYHKIVTLTAEEKKRGVIAASAGNHAQGVALAASLAGIESTVVMPEQAPLAKVMATKSYGAKVVLSGAVYDEAYEKAKALQSEGGQTFIHAFDDWAVMAGQGTIGLEILAKFPEVNTILVPVGGGGLAAGVAVAVKNLKPKVKVIGVQAEGASAMYQSFKAKRKITTPNAVTMADGIAVKIPGDRTFEIIQHYLDDLLLIDDEAVASTILMLLERSKLMVEGAGAVALAAALHDQAQLAGPVVCILSGGNIDVNFISRMIERGLVKAGRRIRVRASVSDRPGELQRLLGLVAAVGANVIEVWHDRTARDVALSQALVELQLETRDVSHTQELLSRLQSGGFVVDYGF